MAALELVSAIMDNCTNIMTIGSLYQETASLFVRGRLHDWFFKSGAFPSHQKLQNTSGGRRVDYGCRDMSH
jgi:hypothetical protein